MLPLTLSAQKRSPFRLFGDATSITIGDIVSKYNYINLEAGRTYGFGSYMDNPVDIIHSFTLGAGAELNTNISGHHFYKAFIDYDVAMFTYVHRTAKIKLDLLSENGRSPVMIRPSVGMSRHVLIGKDLDLKMEIVYGYLFRCEDRIYPNHCLMLRLKYNFNYIRKFIRVF
jgi:hypothetical protein